MKPINKAHAATGLLIVVITAWMASGLFVNDSKPSNNASNNSDGQSATAQQPDTTQADRDALMKVEVAEIFPEIMERKITLQGQLHARRQLQIQADTSGSIAELAVTRGTRITADGLIAELTMEGRASELKEAQARLSTAASEQSATTKLQKQGLQSQLKADQAQATLASATAALERIELEISHLEIRAPFAGIINRLPVEIGQQIEKGAVIAELVDDSTFRVTAYVAQQSVHKLDIGQVVSVKLITGTELRGNLTFISAVADSATRSFEIEAVIRNDGQQLAAGTSASMIIPIEKTEAFFVSPSTIALSDKGTIGIKAVDQNNLVEFYPITLVQTNSSGAWVTGVPSGTRVITLGQGFVNVGQEVQPVLEEPSPAAEFGNR